MLTGVDAFYVYSDTTKSESLHLPRYLSSSVKSLLEGLLLKDPFIRLGIQGSEQLKRHPWCEEINWARMLKKKCVPPFRPNLKISNFDPKIMAIPINLDLSTNYEYESLEFEPNDFSTPKNLMVESNNIVFSDRGSTDGDDICNSLGAARSLDNSFVKEKNSENTESFTLPTKEGKYSDFKIPSPKAKVVNFSSAVESLKRFMDLHINVVDDAPGDKSNDPISLQIPNFSENYGKMKDCIKRKFIEK